MHDWTAPRGIGFGRKEKIERGKGVLNDECERSDDPRRSSSSVREAERRSLFRSIHDRKVSVPAKGRRRKSKSLALASTFGHISEQTNASKHERTRGTRSDEENRRNKRVLKQGAEALEVIYGSTAEVQ